MKKVLKFLKSEAVLSIAVLLAVLSSFVIPPDKGYAAYIDFRTLRILFALMAVMAGLREEGLFDRLGAGLLQKTKNFLQVMMVLMLLCFFGSMIITNDVALITFVPFTFVVLDLLGTEQRKKWVVPIVAMQTVAANLGSMLTPIGNPQNLYLYGKSGMSLLQFVKLMGKYSLVSLALLVIWMYPVCGRERKKELRVDTSAMVLPRGDAKRIAIYGALFLLSLLSVMHIVPDTIVFAVVLLAILLIDRRILRKVDYSLLATFVAFFIFIGNLGRVEWFSAWLGSILSGREVVVAVLASQVTSNVPAALLLSGFTDQVEKLIVGTNLGGLGTLIASMASLISYRQIANGEPEQKGRYFRMFTVSNLVFLAVLLLFAL